MPINRAVILPHSLALLKKNNETAQNLCKACLEATRFLLKNKFDTLIILTSHTSVYLDYFHISPGDSATGIVNYGNNKKRINVNYDTELTELIERSAKEQNIPAGTLGEKDKQLDYGCLVPFYFLTVCDKDILEKIKVIRVGISGLSAFEHYSFGKLISLCTDILNRNTVIIASGNLSKLNRFDYYDFSKEAHRYDNEIMSLLDKADFKAFLSFPDVLCYKAGECGQRVFTIMAGCFDAVDINPEKLSYECLEKEGQCVYTIQKGKKAENRDFSKQYSDNYKSEIEKIRQNEDECVKLARLAIENFVKTKKIIGVPSYVSYRLKHSDAGVFVSVKKNGLMRGCVGTIYPSTACIAQEIIRNAIAVAKYDTRFSPIKEHELKDLVYRVDILKDIEYIQSKDELNTEKYGLIVTRGMKQALILPLSEGIETVDEQLATALKRAGIKEDDDFIMQRFRCVRIY